MTTIRFHPRITRSLDTGAGGRKTRPALGIGLCIVVAALFIVATFGADSPLETWSFAAFALTFSMFGWYIWELASAQAPGFVRILSTGGLHFRPSRALTGLPLVIAAAGSVPLVLRAVTSLTGQEVGMERGSIWMVIASGAAAIWLGQQLTGLRLLTGLAVTEDGLRGVRGAGNLRCTWDEVSELSVAPSTTGPNLLIGTASGHLKPLSAGPLGSDPAVVGTILEHFRGSPADRGRLSSGRDAIRLVEAAHARQTNET